MQNKKVITALAAVTSLALGLGGCQAGTTGSVADGDKLQVVATTTQLQDFITQIAGDKVELTGLLKPGASAHSFDPSPADLVALKEADLLIINGAGLEEYLDSAVTSSGFSGQTVEAASGIDLTEAAEITAEGGGASDTDHDHSDSEDHDHGTVNPHLWTSLSYAADMLDPIVEALSAADPANKEFYEQNAEAYERKLELVDDWAEAEYAKVDPAKKKFVSSHNALLYYLHDYDIQFVGSIIPSFEDNAEPSAAEISQLVENIKASGVPAIFFESSVSDRLSNTVASEADVTLVTDPIYADSLGVEAPANTFIGATIANTQTILQAWGYEPAAPPADATA